jgi:hypothetical protein
MNHRVKLNKHMFMYKLCTHIKNFTVTPLKTENAYIYQVCDSTNKGEILLLHVHRASLAELRPRFENEIAKSFEKWRQFLLLDV